MSQLADAQTLTSWLVGTYVFLTAGVVLLAVRVARLAQALDRARGK